MSVGFAYLDLARGMKEHLWFVIAKPDHDERVIVSVTTRDAEAIDLTCILMPGDHPFIDHESVIFYRKAATVAVNYLETIERRGELVRKPPAADALIDRIRLGAFRSQFTPNYVKKAIDDCFWRPAKTIPPET